MHKNSPIQWIFFQVFKHVNDIYQNIKINMSMKTIMQQIFSMDHWWKLAVRTVQPSNNFLTRIYKQEFLIIIYGRDSSFKIKK